MRIINGLISYSIMKFFDRFHDFIDLSYIQRDGSAFSSPSNWRNYRGNTLHTGESTNNGPVRSSIKFVYDIGNAQIISSPVVDLQSNIYFGSQDGYLYKISSIGSFIWRFKVNGTLTSSPALSYNHNVVYIVAEDSIYAIVTSTGIQIWNYYSSWGQITSSPYLYSKNNNSTLFICTPTFFVIALNATTGSLLSLNAVIGSVDYSSPMFYNYSLYFGCVDGCVYAYTFTYNEIILTDKWMRCTGGQVRYKSIKIYLISPPA